MNYEPAKIRRFLQERFNDEELNHLCFDYFPTVQNDFTVGMRKGQKVQMLLEHCHKQRRWPALMAALERERPETYAEQFAAPPLVEPPRQGSTPIKRNPRQIFISHTHQDAEFAQRLAVDLQAHDWPVWIAPDSIRPGEKWVEAINRGLEESGIFLLVLTPDAVNSRWVKSETNIAVQWEHEGKMRFIPLRMQTNDVPNTPALWQGYQQIPFQEDYKAGLLALFTELEPRAIAQVEKLYQQLQSAKAAGNWSKVQDLSKQIEALYSDYKDVTQLNAQAKRELKRQLTQDEEVPLLFRQLHSLVSEDRGEELESSAALDLLEFAREYAPWPASSIETKSPQTLSKPLALLNAVPVWGRFLLAIAIVGFSIWGLGQLGGGDAIATTPTPEETRPGSTEIASLIQTRIPMPSPAFIETATSLPRSTSTPTFTPLLAETPTLTPLPPFDLRFELISPNVPNEKSAYYDLPDLALVAPTGWQFDLSGEEIQMINKTGDPWQMMLVYTETTSILAPIAQPIPNTSEITSSMPANITITWDVLTQTQPLLPGDYQAQWQVTQNDITRLSGTFSFIVRRPLTVTIPPGKSYRFEPVWDLSEYAIQGGVEHEIVVDVVGKRTVPLFVGGMQRADAIFLLIRLPDTRQVYWLADHDTQEFNSIGWTDFLNMLPDSDYQARRL